MSNVHFQMFISCLSQCDVLFIFVMRRWNRRMDVVESTEVEYRQASSSGFEHDKSCERSLGNRWMSRVRALHLSAGSVTSGSQIQWWINNGRQCQRVASGCSYQLCIVQRCLPFELRAQRTLVTDIHLQLVWLLQRHTVRRCSLQSIPTSIIDERCCWWPPSKLQFLRSTASTAPDQPKVTTSALDILGQASLCAAEHGDLFDPATKTKIGSRRFRVAVPVVWNSLPHHLRETTLRRQLITNGLKTLYLSPLTNRQFPQRTIWEAAFLTTWYMYL